MPLKKYLAEPGLSPEAARAMTEAFAIVTAHLKERRLSVSSSAIAQKVSSLAHEGETDPKRLADAVLIALLPKK